MKGFDNKENLAYYAGLAPKQSQWKNDRIGHMKKSVININIFVSVVSHILIKCRKNDEEIYNSCKKDREERVYSSYSYDIPENIFTVLKKREELPDEIIKLTERNIFKIVEVLNSKLG
ncbi:MAG: hypothetical protein ACP5G1_04525 [Nanopusillaceae archaeon]